MAEKRSLLSIRSEGSILSIGSKNSILSIGSIGSVLSVASIGSFASAFAIVAALLAGLPLKSTQESLRSVDLRGKDRHTRDDLWRYVAMTV